MSRTNRNKTGFQVCCLRNPHTFKEIRELHKYRDSDECDEYTISGMNRIRSREKSLPTSWDDLVISAYHEIYRNI